jgi:hypothetical protein
MNNDRFNQALQRLEELVVKKLNFGDTGDSGIRKENSKLKSELNLVQKKYNELVTTSESVINELNSSIQVIDNFFKKQDANNKNS